MCTRDGQKRQQQQQCNRLQTLHCQEYRHTGHCKLGGGMSFPTPRPSGHGRATLALKNKKVQATAKAKPKAKERLTMLTGVASNSTAPLGRDHQALVRRITSRLTSEQKPSNHIDPSLP